MENDLRISTITSVLKLSHIIDLEKIYKQLPISKRYIPYIEYGCNNIPRGFSEKSLIKKRKKKKKKIFYNQATIHVIHDGKIMNVKLFNNGRIQITGLKNENQAVKLVKKLKTEQNKFVWFKAASAIMTTDTRPKVAYEECKIGNKLIKPLYIDFLFRINLLLHN